MQSLHIIAYDGLVIKLLTYIKVITFIMSNDCLIYK